MQQIKGGVLKSRLTFVEQHGGADALARVLDALPADDRRALGMILTGKWYDFALGRRLDEAIVTILGGGDRSYFERLGEASATANLAGVHRQFLSDRDPHAFLSKAPKIYALYYDQGRREYERAGEREAVLTTFDAETFSAADCLTVVGWHRKALELCGCTGIRVVEEECRAAGGAVCRYRLSWH